jgi:4-diphosphocytidyl-2-C-methyl-D-erythritol kinase
VGRSLSPSGRGGSRRGRTLRVSSFAKINLGLEVLGVRQDGYHELRTLFQTIDVADDIVLRTQPARIGITVECDHPLVPKDGKNLAVRAAEALRRFGNVEGGVHIGITKRIPVGGGLGGGSSNAAAVLRGLARLWRLEIEPARLHALARRLGADVPFFLVGGTALGIARGDEVYALRSQVRAHVVLVEGAEPVSTAAVFHRLDASLTPRENSNSIFYFVSRDLEGKSPLHFLTNDLEGAALDESPALKERAGRIRGVLVQEGAHLAALTGSGSTYFGLFADSAGARRARTALATMGFTAIRARTLTVDQYRRVWSRSLRR